MWRRGLKLLTSEGPLYQAVANCTSCRRDLTKPLLQLPELLQATADLGQINRLNLGTDARGQYDSALRFIRQSEEALKVKNLVYASQLADKAATMAALLRRLNP